jgi:hypothetical protein
MGNFDYGFISSDSHIGTPPHIADELPPEHRRRVTHLEERADGIYLVRPMSGGFAAMAKGGDMTIMSDEDQKNLAGADETIAGYVTGNVSAGSKPSLLPKGRLVDMRRDGIDAEVLIGAGGFGALADPDMEVAGHGSPMIGLRRPTRTISASSPQASVCRCPTSTLRCRRCSERPPWASVRCCCRNT